MAPPRGDRGTGHFRDAEGAAAGPDCAGARAGVAGRLVVGPPDWSAGAEGAGALRVPQRGSGGASGAGSGQTRERRAVRVACSLRGHGRGRGSRPWVTRNCAPWVCRLERKILNRRGPCRLSSALLRRPLRRAHPPPTIREGRAPRSEHLGSKSEICASGRNTRERSTSENHKPRLVPAATERLGTGTPTSEMAPHDTSH